MTADKPWNLRQRCSVQRGRRDQGRKRYSLQRSIRNNGRDASHAHRRSGKDVEAVSVVYGSDGRSACEGPKVPRGRVCQKSWSGKAESRHSC